jgi:ABC-type multidrug transport system ATPase subunit
MCDRVAILREGQLVFEGSVRNLADETPIYQADLETWSVAGPVVERFGGSVLQAGRIALPVSIDSAQVLEEWVKAGVRVREFAKVRRSLEDVYMEILDGRGSPN